MMAQQLVHHWALLKDQLMETKWEYELVQTMELQKESQWVHDLGCKSESDLVQHSAKAADLQWG